MQQTANSQRESLHVLDGDAERCHPTEVSNTRATTKVSTYSSLL